MSKNKWIHVGGPYHYPPRGCFQHKEQSKISKLAQRLKCKFKAKYIIWHCHKLIRRGYLSSIGEPLKCTHCKSTNLEEYNGIYGECHGPIIEEYSVRCKDCLQHLGTNSYGTWDTW